MGETPDCCDTLRRQLEQANDKVQRWINNSCSVMDDRGLHSAAAASYSYKDWMGYCRQVPLGKQKFYNELQSKGYKYKQSQGKVFEFKSKMCSFGISKETWRSINTLV